MNRKIGTKSYCTCKVIKNKNFRMIYLKRDFCSAGTKLAKKSYEPSKIKTSDMTRENILARRQQFKLALMLMNLI